jgi:hypothetical protein
MLLTYTVVVCWVFLPIIITASTLQAKVPTVIVEGSDSGCFQSFHPYYVNPYIQFHICLSQSKEYNVHGRSITELIKGRGYMPTCRVLHLLVWMLQQIDDSVAVVKDRYFMDVGANIGNILTVTLYVIFFWVCPSCRCLYNAFSFVRFKWDFD